MYIYIYMYIERERGMHTYMLESNPLESRVLVPRFAVPAPVKETTPVVANPLALQLASETAIHPLIWCPEG